MTETKVFLAIIDKDLKIRTLKKYPLSKNGQQIHVISGGEAHFMPVITNTSDLEFPYRSITSIWKIFYRRIYFAMNKAKQCIDFESGEVSLPSPEEMKKAIAATLLGKLNVEKTETPIIWYIILLVLLAIAGNVFGVL